MKGNQRQWKEHLQRMSDSRLTYIFWKYKANDTGLRRKVLAD